MMKRVPPLELSSYRTHLGASPERAGPENLIQSIDLISNTTPNLTPHPRQLHGLNYLRSLARRCFVSVL